MSINLSGNSSEMMQRVDELMHAASNRYQIVVQVANRAKRCRYDDQESLNEPKLKPVIRAVVEMSDELTAPELIRDEVDFRFNDAVDRQHSSI